MRSELKKQKEETRFLHLLPAPSPITPPIGTCHAALGCHLWEVLANTAILIWPWVEPMVATLCWIPVKYPRYIQGPSKCWSKWLLCLRDCGEPGVEVQVPSFPVRCGSSSSLSVPPASLSSDSLKKDCAWRPPHSQSLLKAYYLQVKSFVTEGGQWEYVWISKAEALLEPFSDQPFEGRTLPLCCNLLSKSCVTLKLKRHQAEMISLKFRLCLRDEYLTMSGRGARSEVQNTSVPVRIGCRTRSFECYSDYILTYVSSAGNLLSA